MQANFTCTVFWRQCIYSPNLLICVAKNQTNKQTKKKNGRKLPKKTSIANDTIKKLSKVLPVHPRGIRHIACTHARTHTHINKKQIKNSNHSRNDEYTTRLLYFKTTTSRVASFLCIDNKTSIILMSELHPS